MSVTHNPDPPGLTMLTSIANSPLDCGLWVVKDLSYERKMNHCALNKAWVVLNLSSSLRYSHL